MKRLTILRAAAARHHEGTAVVVHADTPGIVAAERAKACFTGPGGQCRVSEGLEAERAVRRGAWNKAPPVAVLIGDRRESRLEEGRRAGRVVREAACGPAEAGHCPVAAARVEGAQVWVATFVALIAAVLTPLLFDELSCLTARWDCIPGYPRSDPAFLESDFTRDEARFGYRRRFHAGSKPVPDARVADKISRSSIDRYAYSAVPAEVGLTGVRASCVDGHGSIYVSDDGTLPEIQDGRCPTTLPVLR